VLVGEIFEAGLAARSVPASLGIKKRALREGHSENAPEVGVEEVNAFAGTLGKANL